LFRANSHTLVDNLDSMSVVPVIDQLLSKLVFPFQFIDQMTNYFNCLFIYSQVEYIHVFHKANLS
jgi:hypothetical protein